MIEKNMFFFLPLFNEFIEPSVILRYAHMNEKQCSHSDLSKLYM